MFKFKPSSSKELDISSLRVALINYIVAKQKSDELVFTIDDNVDDKDAKDSENLEILKKFSIDSTQKVFRSKNKNIYQNLALKLLQDSKAFICFCNNDFDRCQNNCLQLTQEDISKLKDSKLSFSIRVKEPSKSITFKDLLKGNIEIEPKEIDSFAILKSNTEATDIFASAIDNMLLNINTIIEDESVIKNSAKEIYILDLLEYEQKIEYAHVPSNPNCKNITVKSLFKQGFLPDTIINYLLKVGNSSMKNIFYLPDAIDSFNIKDLSNNVEFNIQELKSLNKKHLELLDDKKLSQIFGFSDSDIGKLAKLFLIDATTINELITALKAVFSAKKCTQDIKELINIIQNAPMFSDFEEFKSYIKSNSNFDEKILNELLRVILTGSSNSSVELEKVYNLINPYLLEVARCQ